MDSSQSVHRGYWTGIEQQVAEKPGKAVLQSWPWHLFAVWPKRSANLSGHLVLRLSSGVIWPTSSEPMKEPMRSCL